MKKSLLFAFLAGATALSGTAAVKVTLTKPGTIGAQVNEPCSFFVSLRNQGDEVTKVKFGVTVGAGEEYFVDVEPAIPVATGAYAPFEIAIPAQTEEGSTVVAVRPVEVNGEEYAGKTVNGNLEVKEFSPRVIPLMEDYTGTWCGFCPQGFVVMERLHQSYPDKALLIAYHNGDPMAVSGLYSPSSVSGYPSLFLNRSSVNAAGNTVANAMVKSNEPADVLVNVDASWADADNCDMNTKVTLTFTKEVVEGDYRVQIFVIADDLTGTTSSWKQHSYYGDPTNSYGVYGKPGFIDPLWDQFIENEWLNLVFNDVCVADQIKTRKDYDASVPYAEAKTPVVKEYLYKNLNKVNESGGNTPIIQHPDKVKLGAVVVDKQNKFVNCGFAKVQAYNPGSVNTVTDGDANAPKEYYNLQGVKVNGENLTPGIYIVRQGRKVSKIAVR